MWRHHRAARKPRLTRARAKDRAHRPWMGDYRLHSKCSKCAPPPPPASPRLAAAHAHTHALTQQRTRTRTRSRRSRSLPRSNPQASFEPGAKRSSLDPRTDRPPPLAVLTKASRAVPPLSGKALFLLSTCDCFFSAGASRSGATLTRFRAIQRPQPLHTSPGSYTRIRLAASAMSSRAPSSRRCANSHLEGHSFSGIATHSRRWSSAQ